MKKAILVDYKYCTGCHTCEIACQKHLGLEPGKWGIKLTQIGPDEYEPGKWQYEFIPVPTDRCDSCATRIEAGKKAMCEQHCQAGCITVGDVVELAKQVTGEKFVLFA